MHLTFVFLKDNTGAAVKRGGRGGQTANARKCARVAERDQANAAAAGAGAAAAGPAASIIPRAHFLFDDDADDRTLGDGPHGIVFRGSWLGKPVALKVLRMKAAKDNVRREMEAEVAALSKLQHANIIALHGATTVGTPFVLVAELMDSSLYKVLADSGEELAWLTRWRIAHGVAAGLAFLEEKGIVHGNVKSANVLLDKARRVAKLSDLGRAQQRAVAAGGDKSWAVAWTAPELLVGPKAAHASDVYSFGVVLWELASRKLPFADVTDEAEVVRRIKKGQMMEFDADAPAALVGLARSAWTLDPARRPKAAAMMSAIDRALKAVEKAEETALVQHHRRPRRKGKS